MSSSRTTYPPFFLFFFFFASWRKLFYRYISLPPEINFPRARRKSASNFFEVALSLSALFSTFFFLRFSSFFISSSFDNIFSGTKNLSSNFADLFRRIETGRRETRDLSLYFQPHFISYEIHSHTWLNYARKSREGLSTFDRVSSARQRTRSVGDGTRVLNDISQHYLRETVGTLQWNRSRSLYLGSRSY